MDITKKTAKILFFELDLHFELKVTKLKSLWKRNTIFKYYCSLGCDSP